MGNGVWELYGQRRKQAEGNLRHTNEIHQSVRNEKVGTERAALCAMHTESRNAKEEERIGICIPRGCTFARCKTLTSAVPPPSNVARPDSNTRTSVCREEGDDFDLPMNQQREALQKALQEMYDVISFDEGMEPNWTRMKEVFLPDARFTRITPEGVDHFDLPNFQAMAMEMLDRGVYTAFYEREIVRRAEIFGSMAHVLSAYETKRNPTAAACLARGVNSIQLLWTGDRWRVLSLLWDEEDSSNPTDLNRVFSSEVERG